LGLAAWTQYRKRLPMSTEFMNRDFPLRSKPRFRL
jgi:hypothetical protein